MTICCASCGQSDQERVINAGDIAGAARVANHGPRLPDECRELFRSGVRSGDRMHVPLRKTDAALSRHHQRTIWCAEWHDNAVVAKVIPDRTDNQPF